MNFLRKSNQILLNWKNKPERKPLIIRGARQVGKTTLVNQFSQHYSQFISLNLERSEHRNIFKELEQIKDIVNVLFLRTGVQLGKEPVLIFIDEIQESPEAIQQLRFFYEDFPQLHVIAAGSLLEFALRKVASFPVGRVEQIVLHSMDFEEFLQAQGLENLIKQLNIIPVHNSIHSTVLELFHKYATVGGMPEVVKKYLTDGNFIGLKDIYDNIWQGYRDDVEKYANNATERSIIRHIINTAVTEKDRINFAGFGHSHYKSREVGEALRSLDLARIFQLIYPTTYLSPPAIPDIKRKPRLQFLDTGLLNHALGLQSEMIGIKDMNDFYRGKIIQHLVTQQLQALSVSPVFKPVFWVREQANSNAEIDLVTQSGKYLIPIEVKSGESGKLRSLHQFVERAEHPYTVRLSANHFSVEKVKTPGGRNYLLMNLPYYLAYKIPQYLEWFISHYKL